MRKKRVVKSDGRYLILYEFDNEKPNKPQRRKGKSATKDGRRQAVAAITEES